MTDSRIKILYIQVAAGGGSLIALYELLRQIDTSKFAPVVLCYQKNNFNKMLEGISGCSVVYLPSFKEKVPSLFSGDIKNKALDVLSIQLKSIIQYLFFKKEYSLVLGIIKKEKPSLIHHNNDVTMNRQAIRASKKSGIAQIVHHRSLANYGYDRISKRIDNCLMKKVKASIYISQTVADHFKKLYRHTFENDIVIHDFVDVNKFTPSRENIFLKTFLGILENDIVISSVGRIKEWKGQHILIAAINLLKHEFENIKVLIVGSDEEGVGSKKYRKMLQNLVNEYRLNDKIFFTGNRDDIADIINLSDIVVHSSVKPEPQGLIIIETLLCKKTIIASGFAGSQELIQKYGGYSFYPVTAESLAEKIKHVLLKKENIPVDVKYMRLKNDFNPAEQINIIKNLYNHLLKN